MKKGLFYFSVIFALLISLIQCTKIEPDKIAATYWNPDLALPVAYANFGVRDILAYHNEDEIVVIDPNSGALALVYNGDIFSFSAQELLQFNDLSFQQTFSLADFNLPTIPSFNATLSEEISKNIALNINNIDVEMHRMLVESGGLDITITTELKHDINAIISFPYIKRFGTPLSLEASLTYNGAPQQSTSLHLNLADYEFDFTLGGQTVNEIMTNISATIVGTGNGVIGNESLNFNFSISDIQFKNLFGYFGQQDLGLANDTILLRIFDNSTEGYFEFFDPKIKFFFDNELGLPATINFGDIKTINAHTGQEYPLTGFPSSVFIDAPSALGETATTTLFLNSGNTQNLSTIVSPTPKYLYFDASSQSNPQGFQGVLNHIEGNDRLALRTEVELPLLGFAHGFVVVDTMDFKFVEELTSLESVLFRLRVDNGFPVDLLPI